MAHSKLYTQMMNSREWRELRTAKLQANPLCECCLAQGYVTASRCVHHLVPVESGRTDEDCRTLCFQWSNLQALCYKCHAEIHKAERSHSKAAHQQRSKDRLEQWIAKHKNPPAPFNPESDFTPKSTCPSKS